MRAAATAVAEADDEGGLMAELHRRQLLVGGAAGIGLLAAGCTTSSGSGSGPGATSGTSPAGGAASAGAARADFEIGRITGPDTIAVTSTGVELRRGGEVDTVVAVDRGATLWQALVGSTDPTRPHGIADAASAPDGSFWVVNRGARRIRHLTVDGEVDRTVDAPMTDDGRPAHIAAISVAADGRLFVADAAARITVFTPDGTVADQLGGRTEEGNPVAIDAISVEGDGVWVLEHGRPTVVRFDLATRKVDQRLRLGRLSGPHELTTTKDHVYVAWAGAVHRTPVSRPGEWEERHVRAGQVVALHRTDGEALTASIAPSIPWAV